MATYALTTIGDTLTGTTGNDTFNATYDAAAGLDTFNDTDILNGRGGIDTLNISHLQDVAITPPDTLWTGISNIEKIVINTTGDGAQTITTGGAFQAAFGAAGVDLMTTTSGAGAIDIIMTTFTGVATLKTTSVAGAQTITTGSGATIVTGANSGAGAINIKGVGLTSVTASTTGAGAQSIGDGSGNGAHLVSVTATSAGGAQSITSTSTNAVTVAAISAAGTQTIITGAGADIITASTTASVNTIDTGDGNDTITISAIASGNYTINAGAGDDTMTGGAGVDTLVGGSGNDTYYVNTTGDVITENSGVGEGWDVVYSTVSYTIGANVESLVLTGTAAINGTGNTQNNYLVGNIANNSLDGQAGADTMRGGAGDDSYTVDDAGDLVIENTGEGFDAVYSGLASYTLGANIEALILTGTAVSGFGNAGNNIFIGNTANNNLDGGAGSDNISGGAGDDTLDGGVSDSNISSIDTLKGDAGNDTFLSRGFFGVGDYRGGDGIDLLDFSQSDSYTAGRRTAEGAGVNVDLAAGTATTYYRVADNFTWADLNGKIAVSTIENVRGTAQADRLFGDSNANVLEGGAGNDVLNGGAGADTLIGGTGNDSYYVDNAGDVVTENPSGESDGVWSSLSSYTLANNVESLGLLVGALNGTGNAGDNYLLGNSANNVLDGGTGADTLVGGLGNDTYYVDNIGDVVMENAGGGTDGVWSSLSDYTLADNVESFGLLAGALNGTGNAGNNFILGNTANNSLTGGEGVDTLVGGLGKDTYNLTETTPVTDTLAIAAGDSVVTNYDVANNFKLGTGTINTAGVDRLDLVSTVIATNAAAVNGADSGTILSHSINNGIISFDNIDNYTSPLTITAATNLADVFGYLQTNIIGGDTVAFVSEGNTFVFQDGGINDTLVELVGVSANSINTSGLASNAVWIV